MPIKKQTTKTSSKKTASVTATKTAPKAQSKSQVSSKQIQEYIQTRAYYVWEEWGKPEGQEDAIWQQATKDIKKKFNLK